MRTEKNTEATKKAMLNALESSLGVVVTASRKVGICRNTHYRWIKEDPEYKKAVDDIENVVLDFAESQLHQQIKGGNATSTIFFLKTKGKRRGYIERHEFEHSGKVDSDTRVEFVTKQEMTEAEKDDVGYTES